jgi:xanthine dehydrogenase accessory factor
MQVSVQGDHLQISDDLISDERTVAKDLRPRHNPRMTIPEHDSIPEVALAWHRQGIGAVLATVVETWGSAPRPAGSQLAISGDGNIMGSVSGGCVEGAVVAEAAEALANGQPRLLTYGVSDEDAFAVGLACGGTIRVLVEPVGAAMPDAMLERLVTARGAGQGIAYTVNLTDWSRTLTDGTNDPAAASRLQSDRAGLEDDGRFIVPHAAPLRLIVVGAVHIAQPLLSMARLCGFQPTLIDPRETFGAAARFPGETILHDWPDDAMAALAPDARTAVVTLTHDPKLDDPAILAALASRCFYLGCLGSTRTHAKRLDRLRAAGVDEAQIARIHAPVGLKIAAKSPAEIAVSIMAQVIQSLRAG